MSQIKIPLSVAQNLGVEVTEIAVNGITLRNDGSGTWGIGVSLTLVQPERPRSEGVNIGEQHNLNANTTVTRQEIADAAGIDVDTVRSTMTLEQTETTVTGIATGKILAAIGLTA